MAPADIEYARELGYRVKHLGIAKHANDALQLRVHPTLIPEAKAIAQVDGVLNAVMINASGVGELLLVGPGAGSRPTASAVMADVVSLARSIASNEQPSIHSMGVGVSAMSQPVICDINEVASAWYLRLDAEDKPGVMASLTQCLSQCGIGIESLIQKPESAALAKVPVILMTDEAPTRAIEQAIASIEALPSVGGPVACLRVENF